MSDQQAELLPQGAAAPKPSTRRELDRYLTPEWATRALLDAYPEIQGDRLLDPCCGDGRMARQLYEAGRFSHVTLNDLAPVPGLSGHAAPLGYDAADVLLYMGVDWTITNPPFTEAGRIAQAALKYSARGVALLLRCTFGEPVASRAWLTERPPTAVLMLPRISFTGLGHDTAPTWWFIWSSQIPPGVKCMTRAQGAGQLGLSLG